MQTLKVLAEPSNIVQSAHPDTFHNDVWQVGHNPVPRRTRRRHSSPQRWFGARLRGAAGDLLPAAASRTGTAVVAETQGQRGARRFAEKHLWPNYIPVLMRELYPSLKEVFLVRDFRDMAHSIMSFDRKAGIRRLRAPRRISDEQYVEEVLKPAAQA